MVRGPGSLVTSLATALAVMSVAAGPAQAAGPASPATGAPAPVAHTAAPAITPATAATTPAAGRVWLRIPSLFRVKGHRVSVPHRSATVHGRVRPFVAHQWVVVTIALNGKVFKTQNLRVKRSVNGQSGWFTTRCGAPGVGRMTVTVTHPQTGQQAAFSSKLSYASLNERVGPGSTGRFVELVQQRLAKLHFYVVKSGVYDLQTELAVNAYHRLLGRGYATTLDHRTIHDLLNGIGKFRVRFPHHGRHAEADLTHQVLALIAGSKVRLLFPISSGKPSTPTILGSFRIYYRVPGYLPDGMYYSDFFIRGYAIHGYDPSPNYPASHGCLRLPITDAITAFRWLALGDWVDTYYR